MPSLVVGIMAHPKRRQYSQRLLERVTAQCVEAVTDGLEVFAPYRVEDTLGRGVWLTARETWTRGKETGASHVLVLQDDIAVCADLPSTVHQLIAARPHDPISLFSTNSEALHAAAKLDVCWLRTRRFLYSQALLMPRALIESAINWVDATIDSTVPNMWDDGRFAAFFATHSVDVYVTVPSLVQHLEKEIGSLLGNTCPEHERVSGHWVGEQGLGSIHGWSRLEAIEV